MNNDSNDKNKLRGNLYNVFDVSDLSQKNMLTFNKDNAQIFLEKLRDCVKKEKTEFNFEEIINNKKTNYEFKLSYAKEVIRSLVRKKLVREEDLDFLDLNKE